MYSILCFIYSLFFIYIYSSFNPSFFVKDFIINIHRIVTIITPKRFIKYISIFKNTFSFGINLGSFATPSLSTKFKTCSLNLLYPSLVISFVDTILTDVLKTPFFFTTKELSSSTFLLLILMYLPLYLM